MCVCVHVEQGVQEDSELLITTVEADVAELCPHFHSGCTHTYSSSSCKSSALLPLCVFIYIYTVP